jgi:radical SAM protein with 4Fe4S-binding SPASM domain
MRSGGSSYDKVIEKLKLTRAVMGNENVSALMTTTKNNLGKLNQIIDEYVALGFQGVFLRSLNPYGYAKTGHNEKLQYDMDDFVSAYKKAIEYIITLNQKGTYFVEYFATILLTRILTPFSTGFMDLQSPAGVGILGAIYDFNGDVYPSDEGRMLAAMGDSHFRLGNVKRNAYTEIFYNPLLQKIIHNSCVEIVPSCHSCAYQQFCGTDPIRAYSQQNDKNYFGCIPTSEFCKKYKKIISYFMDLIRENDQAVMDVFWSWVTRREYNEVRMK